MKRKVFCTAAVVALAVSACLPHLPAFAEEENLKNRPLIIYELGDERVPPISDNAVEHLQSTDDAYDRPILIYELGDFRVPAMDLDSTDMHLLEEPITKGDFAPSVFYNLACGSYNYSFSKVKEYVFTEAYFTTNGNGYISVSTSGIDNPVRISMIESESGKVVSYWAGDPKTVSGVGFPGDISKFYYFKFEPYDVTSITGSGEIFWDN